MTPLQPGMCVVIILQLFILIITVDLGDHVLCAPEVRIVTV